MTIIYLSPSTDIDWHALISRLWSFDSLGKHVLLNIRLIQENLYVERKSWLLSYQKSMGSNEEMWGFFRVSVLLAEKMEPRVVTRAWFVDDKFVIDSLQISVYYVRNPSLWQGMSGRRNTGCHHSSCQVSWRISLGIYRRWGDGSPEGLVTFNWIDCHNSH